MAETVSLAVLENLVHMFRRDFPANSVSVAAILPEDMNITAEPELRRRVELRELSSRALGDWCIESQKSAVLEVASVVVPDEHNYLLNPAHPEFGNIAVQPSCPPCFSCSPYAENVVAAAQQHLASSPDLAPVHIS